jgi:hypothetical protein
MEVNRTAMQFFHTAPLASARDAKLLHMGKNLFCALHRIQQIIDCGT